MSKADNTDDRWKRKGGAHQIKTEEPEVCPECNGLGLMLSREGQKDSSTMTPCDYCNGDGEVFQ